MWQEGERHRRETTTEKNNKKYKEMEDFTSGGESWEKKMNSDECSDWDPKLKPTVQSRQRKTTFQHTARRKCISWPGASVDPKQQHDNIHCSPQVRLRWVSNRLFKGREVMVQCYDLISLFSTAFLSFSSLKINFKSISEQQIALELDPFVPFLCFFYDLYYNTNSKYINNSVKRAENYIII